MRPERGRTAELVDLSGLDRLDGLAEPARPLAEGLAAGWPARELFLTWLMSLPIDVDPSLAATAVLARFEPLHHPRRPKRELDTLLALFEETTRWPRSQLELRPQRRGGSRSSERRADRPVSAIPSPSCRRDDPHD